MIAASVRTATAACTILALLVLGCGENEAPVNPGSVLCAGNADVALRVVGGAEERELCLDTEDVIASFSNDIYDIIARFEQDGVIFEIQMRFAHHPDFPVTLNVTGDLGAAMSDPLGVWLFYQEIPASGGAIESRAVPGGTFVLGFSGGDVVTGILADIAFEMRDVSTTDPAGTRVIEGLFSVLTDVQPTL